MAVESVAIKAEEKLGTFLTPSDLSQILAPGLRKASVVKSYFVDAELERENRIMEFATQLSNIFLEYYPGKLVTEVLLQFQKLLPDFLEDYGSKYFTKNHIANHFLALFDYRLNMVGSKLSPKHIDEVRDLLAIKKGKTFSFFSMKKVQSQLFASGYLQRKKREIFNPMLKNKVSQIINDLAIIFPDYEEKLDLLQELAFDLIDERHIPRINIDDAALVIVSSLLPYYISDRRIMRTIWVILDDQFDMELEYLKRKVYRYRSQLRKKNQNGQSGLGRNNVEDRGVGDECSSNTS